MTKAQRTIFRAAGGLLLAGGLCIFAGMSAPGAAAQSAHKPGAKPAGSSGTSSAKPGSTIKQGSASKTSSTVRTGSTGKASSGTKSGKKKSMSARSARTRGQMAPTTDRIREIQSALANAGTYSGEPTGKWDSNTTEAMKKFQQSNGLTPTGKLGALSLQKLGLGSSTAGRGAPRVGAPPSAATTPTVPRLQ